MWLAPAYVLLLNDAFEPGSRHGVGVGASYEFHISSLFNIGFGLAYREYPAARSTRQIGYGATLRHFFSSGWGSRDGVYPYLDYGLLLQQTFVEDRGGSAVSHDTRLGAGSVLRSGGVPFFVGIAAHYSRLQYFEVESTWIPYLELDVGWLHTF